MLMIQRPLNIIDSRIRHPTPLKHIQPLLRSLRLEPILDDPIQRIPILDPQRIRHEPRIALPLGLPNLVAQDAVQLVVAAADRDIRVGRFVRAVGDYGGCINAPLAY